MLAWGAVGPVIKLELVCEEPLVGEAVRLIYQHARTGQADAGWIYVTDIGQAIRIDGVAEAQS